MAKKTDEALAVNEEQPLAKEESPFAIVRASSDQVLDIIHLNLGGKKVTAFDLDRISIPDGKSDFWTVPTLEGTAAVEEISGVVVHFRDMRAWWPDADPSGKPPSCRADDGETGIGDRTSAEQYKDEDEVQHDCSKCAYSKWESDPKGGRGQWCKQVRAVFIVPEHMFLPMVLFLPPTSLKAMERYFLRLGAYGVPFNSMVTGIKLVKEKNAEGQAFNRAEPYRLRKLSAEEREKFRSYTEAIAPAFDSVKINSDSDIRSRGGDSD